MTDNEKFLARSWYVLLIILSGMVTALGFALWSWEFPEAGADMIKLMIGAILAKFGDVVAWRINSSKGSSDKTTAALNAAPPPTDEVKP